MLKELVDHWKLKAEVDRDGQVQAVRFSKEWVVVRMVQPFAARGAVNHHRGHAEIFDA